MLTFWCILVAVGSLYFIGLPLAALLCPSEDDNPSLWIIAPFIGLSVIILVLQNLVYLDLRIAVSTPWLWAGGCLLWVWLAKAGRLPSIFSAVPRLPLMIALGVYLVQGLGMLLVGAKYYVGRAWHDQFNYTAIAQFLADYPFSLSFSGIQSQPYLFKALQMKADRIGQSVFHGFLATSTFTDAKTTFEPAILLSPLLITLAVYLLARRLPQTRPHAILVASCAGLLPGIALVHLESFFSQALAIPLLVVWPFVIGELVARPTWKRLLFASLILAAGTSIYTEVYVVYVGLGGVIVAWHAFSQSGRAIVLIPAYLVLVCIGLALNPGFIHGMGRIIRRSFVAGALPDIYPWAYSAEGLQRLWVGEITLRVPSWVSQALLVVSILFAVLAYLGLALLLSGEPKGLRLALLALASLPLLIALRGRHYGYQFYKILLSISPLLPLGIMAIPARCAPGRPWMRGGVVPIATRLGGATLLTLCFAGTIDMTLRTGIGRTLEEIGRGGAHKLLLPATRNIQEVLTKLHGEEIYILWEDEFYRGAYVNAWLAYFARRNRVWIANPLLGDIDIEHWTGSDHRPTDLSSHAVVLTSPSSRGFVAGQSFRLVLSAAPYLLWRLSGEHWAILTDIANPNGRETLTGEPLFWVSDRDTTITVLAGTAGVLSLSADFVPGPSVPESNFRDILVRTESGYSSETRIQFPGIPTSGSTGVLSMPIAKGQTRITIRGLDRPTVLQQPSGDRSPLLVGVHSLRLQGFE